MPKQWTFQQPKLIEFILNYIPHGSKVLIPFAGMTKIEHEDCTFVYNDINPDLEADFHIDAFELKNYFEAKSFEAIIADPPYTHYQAIKTYNNKRFQKITLWRKTANFLLKAGGIYIELGYNSTGLSQFIARNIALGICNCGGSHNDILVLVQEKFGKLEEKENEGDMLLV